MQSFYKHITNIKQLNEIIIKYIENSMHEGGDIKKIEINNFFYIQNNVVSAFDKNIFIKDPSKLLEIFLIRNTNNDLLQVIKRTYLYNQIYNTIQYPVSEIFFMQLFIVLQ
jgi:UTP:GlnB (protein PII) uridylyltransferase